MKPAFPARYLANQTRRPEVSNGPNANSRNKIRQIRRSRESLSSGNEQARLTPDAVMAEVGVYQGCSARIISEASDGAALHLFDTFAGLPKPHEGERARLHEGQYAATLNSVRAFLADRPNIDIHVGVFPSSDASVAELKFSFVHLDVDLKSSTVNSLDFFSHEW